jgi:hypothetical protein
MNSHTSSANDDFYRSELKKIVRRQQIFIFILTYITHCLSELGASNEIITATFYI